MAASRVLVTGALGNVGREVARVCAARGFVTRVAGTRAEALAERFPAEERVRLDFLDHATWSAALTGCEQVFLLRPPPIGNMAATLNPFIDAAYSTGVKHIVFLSVAGADRMKWVPHHKVEAHLQQSKGAWTVLRPGFFAQNLQDAYRRDIVEDDRVYVPAADGKIAFLDVRDAAEIAARVFGSPREFDRQALVLTGPEAITFHTVAEVLSRTIGKQVSYVPASIPGYAWHLLFRRHCSLIQTLVQTILHTGLRRGDAEFVAPTVERILGRPARSVSDYAAHAAAMWRAPG